MESSAPKCSNFRLPFTRARVPYTTGKTDAYRQARYRFLLPWSSMIHTSAVSP